MRPNEDFKRHFTGAWLAVVLLLFFTSRGKACSCGRTTVEEAFAIRDVVFLGEVIGFDIVQISTQSGDYPYFKIAFRILMSWKGVEEPEVIAYADMGSGSCGYDSVSVGDQFLIYAGGEYTGFSDIYFHICTRSHRLIDGQSDDISILNSIVEPTIFADESTSGQPPKTGALCGNLGFLGVVGFIMFSLTVMRCQRGV